MLLLDNSSVAYPTISGNEPVGEEELKLEVGINELLSRGLPRVSKLRTIRRPLMLLHEEKQLKNSSKYKSWKWKR
jgi:hypothetical protein